MLRTIALALVLVVAACVLAHPPGNVAALQTTATATTTPCVYLLTPGAGAWIYAESGAAVNGTEVRPDDMPIRVVAYTLTPSPTPTLTPTPTATPTSTPRVVDLQPGDSVDLRCATGLAWRGTPAPPSFVVGCVAR